MSIPSLKQPEFTCEDPWMHSDFQQRPTKHSDSWRLSWWHRGWLIREHGSSRSRAFQPLHETLPVEAEDLLGERVTVAFLDGNPHQPHVHHDRWDLVGGGVLPFVMKGMRWVGYTLIRRGVRDGDDRGNPSGPQPMPRFGGPKARAEAAGSVDLRGVGSGSVSGSPSVKAPLMSPSDPCALGREAGSHGVRMLSSTGWSIYVEGSAIEVKPAEISSGTGYELEPGSSSSSQRVIRPKSRAAPVSLTSSATSNPATQRSADDAGSDWELA